MKNYINLSELESKEGKLSTWEESYKVKDIQKQLLLAIEVNACNILCEVMFDTDNGYQASVIIKHPYLESLHIWFDEYQKRYNVCAYEISRLPYVSHYAITEMRKKLNLVEPNNIGKLTKKKIQDWVTYYEKNYLGAKEISDNNNAKINEFLELVKNSGEIVRYSKTGLQGWIIRNGLEYSFEVTNDGWISQKIQLRAMTINLETFKQLADNKYISKD